MKQQAPSAVYTTLALFRNLETRVHSDKGNDPQQLNTIVKVSNFSDGGLWIADPQGKVPCPLSDEQAHGRVLPFDGQVLSFDAQQPHCVMPRPDSTAGPESPLNFGVTTALQEPGPTNPVPVGPMRPQASDRNAPLESSGVLRNSGKSIQPSFLEIFCGSAGLSAAVRKLGFQVLGVDHKPTAKHANAPFISLDLRDHEQQERLWVELRRVDAVWLAPPCGTSSSARSIPLGNSKHGPKPLRSKEFPDGLPTLADVDRDRVDSANLLYDFTAKVFRVLDPDTGTVSYFESAALPFGASSAVTGFNRAARALRIIMSRLLFLVNTSFFDDFCQLEIDGLTDSADQAALALLDLLGWEVSDGDKLKPFASEFTMLGAVLSFKDAGRGLIRIRNKAGRVEEIGDMVERLASDPVEGARSLPSLKGKLLFAASHVFGRRAQAAVRRALDTLKAAGDRQVNLWSEQPPVIVFTDGACEERGSQVTHGAVIVDVASQTHEVFGGHIPGLLLRLGAAPVVFN
ncbi:unnamed protein product [Symbiodinium sp. CCMP2592]|nr:unnamed protein product [Symbiodinium sp. CCMP2592]